MVQHYDSEKTYFVDDDNLLTTIIDDEKGEPDNKQISRKLFSMWEDWTSRRKEREDVWLESWANYFGTPTSHRWVRERVAVVQGRVDEDWKHQLSSGKGYEVVETVHSWLMGAFFPSKNWFSLIPRQAIGDKQWKKLLRSLQKFINYKLEACNFRSEWDVFLRQMLITGTSVIALPWRLETKKTFKNVTTLGLNGEYQTKRKAVRKVIHNSPELETLDIFDVALDPDASDPNEAGFIRRIVKTKGELLRLHEDGIYAHCQPKDIKSMRCASEAKGGQQRRQIQDFLGISGNTGSWHPDDRVEIFEFWGDVTIEGVEYQDIVITFTPNFLLNIETNPYWNGKPFIVGTYVRVNSSPYGVGSLDPILGHIYEINSTMNQRLDNMSLAINNMWLCLNDGTVDISQVYSEPGHTIPVADLNAIRPIERDTNLQVSVQEEQLLEQKADKTTGVVPFIAAGQGRNAERVTKAEVDAQREAGGNRLNERYSHIESTALIPLLLRVYCYCQQFVVSPEVVRIKGDLPDSWEYIEIGAPQLQFDMDVSIQGAGHVAMEELELRNRMDFVKMVGSVPQMTERVNWDELLIDFANRFLGDDYERFIREPDAKETQQPVPNASQDGAEMVGSMPMGIGNGRVTDVPIDAGAQLENAATFAGGQPGQLALQEALATQEPSESLAQFSEALGVK